MQPDIMHIRKTPVQPNGLYAELMAHAVGLPNDELFAQLISSQFGDASALPPGTFGRQSN